MNTKDYFQNKKITQMGLGLLGRGLGDAIFLAKNGAKLIITDLKNKEELETSLSKLKKYKNIKYVLGRHRLEDFENRDMILKSAGIPLKSGFLEKAKENKIPIEMDESLFVKLSGIRTIGVTGTRGKTTVATLIFQILKDNEKKLGCKVYLGGNIKGVATLPLLEKVKNGDIVVMELSSWQLQGFGDSKISPHISVFTNFYDDHLNYYKNNRQKYFNDKAQIFKYQKENDLLFFTKQAKREIKRYFKNKIISKKFLIDKNILPKSWKIKLKGEHNRENIALGIKVAQSFGISLGKIKKSVENFGSVEGRLQFLRKYRGIEIYNDNNATSPEATISAVNSFEKKEIILIIGGSSKGLDTQNLVEEIKKRCKKVVLFKEKGTDEIKEELLSYKNIKCFEEDGLENCLNRALEKSKKGSVLLFSPAFASFGKYFKNEFDRGDQFCKLVKKLK